MPGVVRTEATPAVLPVRVVEDAPKTLPRPQSPARAFVAQRGKAATMIEVVLSNGRVLRVSEAIRTEVLGRLAAALEA